MTSIHLDANYLMRLVRAQREVQAVREWAKAGMMIQTSSIAWAEFLCGPVEGTHIGQLADLVGIPVPFDGVDSLRAARLFNGTGRRRRSMPDCMIAAVALRMNAQLATNNLRDFQCFIPFGLQIAE